MTCLEHTLDCDAALYRRGSGYRRFTCRYGSSPMAPRTTASTVTTPGMPPQFYTTAPLVAPRHVYAFDEVMYVAFLVLQGLALLFLWAVFGVVLFWALAASRCLSVSFVRCQGTGRRRSWPSSTWLGSLRSLLVLWSCRRDVNIVQRRCKARG